MELGRKLWIRSLVNVCAEPVPFFWPMRTFVHHNPLHELEEMPFEEAVRLGKKLFGGRGFLRREDYQHLMERRKISKEKLRERIEEFLDREGIECGGLPLADLVFKLLVSGEDLRPKRNRAETGLPKELVLSVAERFEEDPRREVERFLRSVGEDKTLYEAVDLLSGSNLGEVIDDLVVKSVMGFLDEGQAAISMPHREEGLFRSWQRLARHNLRFLLRAGLDFWRKVQEFEEPEEAIEGVLKDLKIPESLWEGYITKELTRLKGIVGFIRWRQSNRDYFWQRIYPVDVVDYTAIRLLVSRSVLRARTKRLPFGGDYEALREFLTESWEKAYLLLEYYGRRAHPSYAHKLPEFFERPREILERYVKEKALWEARVRLTFLKEWLSLGDIDLSSLSYEQVEGLLNLWEKLEEKEGTIWLKAMEDTLVESLISEIRFPGGRKDVNAQALFCIDVRSERYRRNLERVGNYETYGIAGFFGVPMAFVELHKGHEEFLCPVIIRPRNVVLEMPVRRIGSHRKGILEEVLHDLKENVLTPYVTVEAIGFLFGFDFIGKTFFPSPYTRARENLFGKGPKTQLLMDKLSPEEIESITRSLFTRIIRIALGRELGIEDADEAVVSEVFEAVKEDRHESKALERLGVDRKLQEEFFKRLKDTYRVDRGYVQVVRERLKQVGFTAEEKAVLVANALRSVGLTRFAPIVLVLGHGSRSENNPYESALDCGACGGASGIHNARAFCRMANDPKVRELLRERYGIDIPDSTFFVPGLHNTTTDEVVLHDLDLLPPKLLPLIEKIEEDLKRATEATALERARELETDPDYGKVLENAYDWSQVRPEWGLSGNYAFIIGRRDLTKDLNLEGKVFLHSYDYRIDRKGFLLENILSGPLVVGQWINMEHYFSTTDNEVYGSGSKVYHNVAGRIGVMTGNVSDLRTGLPSQTVLRKGKPFHTPVRLIVLIEAPFEFAKSTLYKVHKIRELMLKEWINVIILDPETKTFHRFMDGEWREIGALREEVRV